MNPFKTKISARAYHEDKAIGSTQLKRVLRSPAHFLREETNPTPPTPAMQFGTLAHSAILEPELFSQSLIVQPDFSGTGSRAAKGKWLEENSDKTIVTPEQMTDIKGMINAVDAHQIARALLHQGEMETSFFMTDLESGIDLKVRPDCMRDSRTLVDLKTTTDGNPQTFGKVAAHLGYHISGALYLDVVSTVTGQNYDKFVLLVVERSAPYAVSTFILDSEAIDLGRKLYRKALTILAECKASGRYDAYDPVLYTLALPRYVFTEYV